MAELRTTMEQSIRERLGEDLKEAMRARDASTRDAIRYIMAAVKNAEIDHRGALPPAEEVAVVRRVGKQLVDAAEQYRAAGRAELAEREEAQLAVLERYLPAELGDDELAALVREVVDELGAQGPKEMGKVMPKLMERVAGRADGRRISAAARAALSGGA